MNGIGKFIKNNYFKSFVWSSLSVLYYDYSVKKIFAERGCFYEKDDDIIFDIVVFV